jgi:hypothetical protein
VKFENFLRILVDSLECFRTVWSAFGPFGVV